MKYRLLTIICLGICLGIFIFGFWPFGYKPINTARFLNEKKGIHFGAKKDRIKLQTGGVAYTPQPIAYLEADDLKKGSLSLEIWAEAAEKFNSGIGSFAVLAGENSNQKILIGQWKSSLIIRTFFYNSKRSRYYREIGVREVLPTNNLSFITITSDSKGTTVYKDGRLVKHISGVSLIPGDESLTGYRIFLGNGPHAGTPWSGNLYGFALYNRALTESEALNSYRYWSTNSLPKPTTIGIPIVRYDFEDVSEKSVNSSTGGKNSLFIPPRVDLRQKILHPIRYFELDMGDILINLAGFVPFGFFLPLWLFRVRHVPLWRSSQVVILIGFLISLSIELFQAYMPTRDSSQLDLLCNTLGTIVGNFLIYWSLKRYGAS